MIERYQEHRDGPWDRRKAAHLLRRMVIGPTTSEISRAVEEGRERTVDRLLTPWEPETASIQHLTEGPVLAEVRPLDSREYAAFFAEKNLRYTELVQWWLRSMIRGPLSAQERLTWWWHQCVPTSLHGAHFAEHVFDQNKIMRTHAMGSWKKLLDDVIHGTALQIYLSGTENRWHPWFDGVNENLAREMMELFTLGRLDPNGDLNYSQQDISNAARALSGWRLNEKRMSKADGISEVWRERSLLWRQDHWDHREKQVFGRTGAFNSRDVLNMLLDDRAADCARYLCLRWYRSFVNVNVDRTFVDEMSSILVANDLHALEMLRTVLNSRHFYDERHVMSIPAPPLINMIGPFRYAGVSYIPDLDDADGRLENDLVQRLQLVGQCPFYPPNVSGWPDGLDQFSGTLVSLLLEFRRAFWDGTVSFKDFDGGRPVYTFDASNIDAPIEHLCIDLLGLTKTQVERVISILELDPPPMGSEPIRHVVKKISVNSQALFI